MSRKPENPKNGTENKAKTYEVGDIATGRRFSGNEEILAIEQEMAENGTELPNRAIPIQYHQMNNQYTCEQITELVEAEVQKDVPNKALIGYLNELKAEL
jgi:hypothetical protein